MARGEETPVMRCPGSPSQAGESRRAPASGKPQRPEPNLLGRRCAPWSGRSCRRASSAGPTLAKQGNAGNPILNRDTPFILFFFLLTLSFLCIARVFSPHYVMYYGRINHPWPFILGPSTKQETWSAKLQSTRFCMVACLALRILASLALPRIS